MFVFKEGTLVWFRSGKEKNSPTLIGRITEIERSVTSESHGVKTTYSIEVDGPYGYSSSYKVNSKQVECRYTR